MRKLTLILIGILSLVFLESCSESKEANIEVIEIGDIIKFKQIVSKTTSNYQGNNNIVIEMILHFRDTDYGASSNYSSNDYYIIKGNDKLSPLDLKIGSKLYFDVYRIDETNPCQAYGGYLYLIEM